MARKKKIKRILQPDIVYNNVMVAKFINQVMRRGKKTIARKIVYGAFDIIKEKTPVVERSAFTTGQAPKEPLEIFEKAIKNTSPLLEVKSKRVGGATYQVPREVKEGRKVTLAMRWLIQAAKSKKGKPMKKKLAEELILASNNQGSAVKKKEDTHRMAEANRAFAHFSW